MKLGKKINISSLCPPIQGKVRKFTYPLMGEGFILLTRGYGFMGGVYHPPFDTLEKCTSAYDMNLKLYR